MRLFKTIISLTLLMAFCVTTSIFRAGTTIFTVYSHHVWVGRKGLRYCVATLCSKENANAYIQPRGVSLIYSHILASGGNCPPFVVHFPEDRIPFGDRGL